ncbi:hypothetical protein PG5_54510 [Pseudomonas sp. G5(2012)]|nr:hypothetical protein PG5_54510 [Pseudomonas sp. G5(2012)]
MGDQPCLALARRGFLVSTVQLSRERRFAACRYRSMRPVSTYKPSLFVTCDKSISVIFPQMF